MKKKVIVLGGGLVGSVMALDLAFDEDYAVTVADANRNVLDRLVARSGDRMTPLDNVDFSSPASITRAVKDHDIVVGAVPGSMGFAMMGAVIRAGKSMSDISFMGEDYFRWDEEAKKAGVTLMEDVGVSPGFSNMLIGSSVSEMDSVESVEIYVTGLPTEPKEPFNYRFVFSPDDCIEEYVRPVRLKRSGKIIEMPALSENMIYRFKIPGVELPEMEGFLTDGLRSLLKTIPASNICEKTLRYPGTAERLAFLREIGLFSTGPVKVKGQKVVPRDVFAALAYPMMKLGEKEKEFTFLQVDINGYLKGKPILHRYRMYDERDEKTGYTSMARTTGFTCVIMARLIAEGLVDMPGVHAPEAIGDKPEVVARFIAEMEKRGVKVTKEVSGS